MRVGPVARPSWIRLLFVLVGLAATAACAGKSIPNPTVTPYPTPTPTATPMPTPTPSPTPTALATTLAVAAAPLSAAPIPAPSGYTSKLTVPLLSTSANATVAISSFTSLPASLPVLSKGRVTSVVRIPQASQSNYVPIFFDSLIPSVPITVAGAVVASQGFPAGVLSTSTQYYLGFYDSTQPSPAWQTISGPVTTTDGLTLTFSGSVGSFTLQANALYGFAIFSVAAGVTSTPPPAPQTLAYIPNEAAGTIAEVNASGTVATSLPILANSVGLDDSGNVYTIVPTSAPTANPSSSASPPPPAAPVIQKYAPATGATTTYTPSNPYGVFIETAGSGAFLTFGLEPTTTGLDSATYDVWNPGATGSPSYTITLPANEFFGLMGHDGTIYAPQTNANGSYQYNVYAPGSASLERVIPETIVSAANQPNFSPNYAAVGPDGTLYVTEFSFISPDALAGLYIYRPNGAGGYTETYVATTMDPACTCMAPDGVDVDASGNVYVANNDSSFIINGDGSLGSQPDGMHDIEVFGPYGVGGPNGAATPTHITGNFDAYPVAVSASGTLFFSSFPSFQNSGVSASFAIAAGTKTVTQITSFGATDIVLYDGNRETTSTRRGADAVSGGATAHGFGGPLAARLAIARRLAQRHH